MKEFNLKEANSTMYANEKTNKAKVKPKKCAECPNFEKRCKTKNGEMKPCSKWN